MAEETSPKVGRIDRKVAAGEPDGGDSGDRPPRSTTRFSGSNGDGHRSMKSRAGVLRVQRLLAVQPEADRSRTLVERGRPASPGAPFPAWFSTERFLNGPLVDGRPDCSQLPFGYRSTRNSSGIRSVGNDRSRHAPRVGRPPPRSRLTG